VNKKNVSAFEESSCTQTEYGCCSSAVDLSWSKSI